MSLLYLLLPWNISWLGYNVLLEGGVKAKTETLACVLNERRMCVCAHVLACTHPCKGRALTNVCHSLGLFSQGKYKISDENFLDFLHPNLKIYVHLHSFFPLSLIKKESIFLLFLFSFLSLISLNCPFISCPLSASSLYFFLLL